MLKLNNKMERNLQLLGSTGINDELQDDLEDTLDYFIKTGIKVWVLTGDKFDTAKSIAFSCKLITQDFKIFEFEEFLNEKKISVYLDNFLYYLNEFYDYKQNLFSRNDIENSLDSNLRDKLNKSKSFIGGFYFNCEIKQIIFKDKKIQMKKRFV